MKWRRKKNKRETKTMNIRISLVHVSNKREKNYKNSNVKEYIISDTSTNVRIASPARIIVIVFF